MSDHIRKLVETGLENHPLWDDHSPWQVNAGRIVHHVIHSIKASHYEHGGLVNQALHRVRHYDDGGTIPQQDPVDVAKQLIQTPRPKFQIRQSGTAAAPTAPEGGYQFMQLPEGKANTNGGSVISQLRKKRRHPALDIPGIHIRTAEAGEPIFHGEK